MILIDADSLLYLAVHKIVTFSEIRGLLKYGKDFAKNEILNLSENRYEQIKLKILYQIPDNFGTEYIEFFTTCTNSFRKALSQEYKANRKGNKWVKMLKERVIFLNDGKYSDTLEADDLIAHEKRFYDTLSEPCLIVTVDSDLAQLGGYIFDVFKEKTGLVEILEDGTEVHEKDYRGLKFVDEIQAKEVICSKMLVGDNSDTIKGVKGFGKKSFEKFWEAEKDKDLEQLLELIAEKYDDKERFEINKKLIIL